ncbi:transcription factor [Ganoderma sinense ZZ0214-1]|uniref:Transcription factor n=1 Tax=Ganoderma sinense ZZ0214-1 TaxID=1077348 RepID=A0A2G8S4U3_9APHY|nr:transcription factor [Ganoderma sinense ZZ0214-1]
MPSQSIGPLGSCSSTTRADYTEPTGLPLTAHGLPTATFMWSPRHPHGDSEVEPRTSIYVRHPGSQMRNTDSNSPPSNSTYSVPHFRASHIMGPSRSSPTWTPSLSVFRKRSSSAKLDHEVSAPPSPSGRFLKLPRVSYNNTPNKAATACDAQSNSLALSASHSAGRANKDTTRVRHQTSSADSGLSNVELRLFTFLYPASQSDFSSWTCDPSMQTQEEEAEDAEGGDGEGMKNAWIKYVYPSPEHFAGPYFRCVWQDKSGPCKYHSKKFLLRRHIESKHLKLRPHKCSYCGKGFYQKSNLFTHLNTHTGDTPHKCHYCEMYFKDPARRYKHMTEVHQHRSRRTKDGRGRIQGDGAGPSAEHDIADVDLMTAAR